MKITFDVEISEADYQKISDVLKMQDPDIKKKLKEREEFFRDKAYQAKCIVIIFENLADLFKEAEEGYSTYCYALEGIKNKINEAFIKSFSKDKK